MERPGRRERARRDFSRSMFGVLAVIVTPVVAIVAAADGATGTAAFFGLMTVVSAIGLERSSRANTD